MEGSSKERRRKEEGEKWGVVRREGVRSKE